ncbi:hypothetical protein [Pendulispora albinea]|uniref:DUF3841 domain-containing protein n=1 Tax=Pendulispora albinea TaxID=2741071 RepID=A0ABZ2LZ86_9BACT
MRLWTVAHEELIAEARRTGYGQPSWERVEPRWIPAYRWVLEKMRERGVTEERDRVDRPPIWAWHSCLSWHQPPTRETIDLLLGLDPCNRAGLRMVTWTARKDRILLSRYGAWCALLDRVVAGEEPSDPGDLFCPPLAEAEPPTWWRPGDELQASVTGLSSEDIEAIDSLETWSPSSEPGRSG